MMARLVALICSIRPTVRRVTSTLAIAASAKISTTPEITAALIDAAKLSRALISRPAPRRGLGSAKLDPPRGAGCGLRPFPEIAGQHAQGGIGEKVDMICKTLVG